VLGRKGEREHGRKGARETARPLDGAKGPLSGGPSPPRDGTAERLSVSFYWDDDGEVR
jgi:hypothetical protein